MIHALCTALGTNSMRFGALTHLACRRALWWRGERPKGVILISRLFVVQQLDNHSQTRLKFIAGHQPFLDGFFGFVTIDRC